MTTTSKLQYILIRKLNTRTRTEIDKIYTEHVLYCTLQYVILARK